MIKMTDVTKDQQKSTVSSKPTPKARAPPKKNDFGYDRLMKELEPRLKELKSSFSLLKENITAMIGLIFVLFIVVIAVLLL